MLVSKSDKLKRMKEEWIKFVVCEACWRQKTRTTIVFLKSDSISYRDRLTGQLNWGQCLKGRMNQTCDGRCTDRNLNEKVLHSLFHFHVSTFMIE